MRPLENHGFFVKTTLKSGSNTCEYSVFTIKSGCFFLGLLKRDVLADDVSSGGV